MRDPSLVRRQLRTLPSVCVWEPMGQRGKKGLGQPLTRSLCSRHAILRPWEASGEHGRDMSCGYHLCEAKDLTGGVRLLKQSRGRGGHEGGFICTLCLSRKKAWSFPESHGLVCWEAANQYGQHLLHEGPSDIKP